MDGSSIHNYLQCKWWNRVAIYWFIYNGSSSHNASYKYNFLTYWLFIRGMGSVGRFNDASNKLLNVG
jgi:hypothetical protein